MCHHQRVFWNSWHNILLQDHLQFCKTFLLCFVQIYKWWRIIDIAIGRTLIMINLAIVNIYNPHKRTTSKVSFFFFLSIKVAWVFFHTRRENLIILPRERIWVESLDAPFSLVTARAGQLVRPQFRGEYIEEMCCEFVGNKIKKTSH